MQGAQEPRREERDGLPVWWAEHDGPFHASLMFRVGISDETLPIRGITHLVEHLTLFKVGRRDHPHNGFVDLDRCVFFASGERDEVLEFLASCCAAVSDLPLDRLPVERRILRTEAEGGGPPLEGRMLAYHYGAAGHGLGAFNEIGLRWLEAEEIGRWAAERFTVDNAVLWMTGAPPDALAAQLPRGVRKRPVVSRPLVPKYPAHVAEGSGGAAVSMLGERSSALTAITAIAADRLYDRLRMHHGIAYAPYGDYNVLGGETAHVMLGSDCQDHHAATVRDEIWRVVQELAESGATEDELSRHRELSRRAMGEPDRVMGALDYRAQSELEGHAALDQAALVAELDALDPALTARAATAALERALILTPASVSAPDDGFGRIRDDLPPLGPGGETFRARKPAALRRRGKHRLVVGDEGVMLADRPEDAGAPPVIRWDDLVMAERQVDGGLMLVGRDETWIQISSSVWDDAGAAVALVEERIDSERIVPAGPSDVMEAITALAEKRGLRDDTGLATEVADLTGLVHDAEKLVDMAKAGRGLRDGLLAVTTARLMWLFAGNEPELIEHPLSELAGAKLDGVPVVTAVVKIFGPEVDLQFDLPRSQGGDVVLSINRAIKGEAA